MEGLRAIRRALVRLLDRLDGVRHPSRRRSVLRMVETGAPERVLFVCLGNVCRSPYAEAVAKARAGGVAVDSVGFIGPGREPPDAAKSVARRRGVDHASHLSRVGEAADWKGADLIVAFDRYNMGRLRGARGVAMSKVVWLGDFDPMWTGKRAIVDPWGNSEADFSRTFERIERCIDALFSAIPPNRASEDR